MEDAEKLVGELPDVYECRELYAAPVAPAIEQCPGCGCYIGGGYAITPPQEKPDPALEDGQLEAIVVAYQMGFEKGLIGARRKNPYGTSWSCDKAWDYGYDEGCIASGRLDDGTL